MNRQYINSSIILSIGYDENAQILEIGYLDMSIRQYFNVPWLTYFRFIDAYSHDIYYETQIKLKFNSSKVRETPVKHK